VEIYVQLFKTELSLMMQGFTDIKGAMKYQVKPAPSTQAPDLLACCKNNTSNNHTAYWVYMIAKMV